MASPYVEDDDLCIIIANLLENAMEYCQQASSHLTVTLTFRTYQSHLIIHCENPIQESIDIERASYIAGLNVLLASWYLFPAQQAAQPGRGIIMQTDVDYGTMTSTVSFLSQ